MYLALLVIFLQCKFDKCIYGCFISVFWVCWGFLLFLILSLDL